MKIKNLVFEWRHGSTNEFPNRFEQSGLALSLTQLIGNFQNFAELLEI